MITVKLRRRTEVKGPQVIQRLCASIPVAPIFRIMAQIFKTNSATNINNAIDRCNARLYAWSEVLGGLAKRRLQAPSEPPQVVQP